MQVISACFTRCKPCEHSGPTKTCFQTFHYQFSFGCEEDFINGFDLTIFFQIFIVYYYCFVIVIISVVVIIIFVIVVAVVIVVIIIFFISLSFS